MEEKEKNITISNEFVDIYKNFNVVSQVDNMNKLSKRELYLLLTVCIDKFSDDDPVIKYNFQPFRTEVMEIFDVQDDKDPISQYLIELIEESGDKYIETDNIVDDKGDKLPDPLTKEEVRDAKINIINQD